MPCTSRIFIFVIALLFVIAISLAASTQATVSPLPQASQGNKTVDETRKNIQVLKGLPEAQLIPLMNFVAVSLGAQCPFCHVTNGRDPKTGFINWIWESDDKPEKQAARRMMQMVLLINGSNKVDFRQNSVTCYTCHRGQTTPVSIPSLPLTRSGHEPGPNDAVAPTTSPARPSVDQIFAKYFEAVGGDKATNTKTLVMKGKREASQNRSWPNEITFATPDKFLMVASTPQAVIRQIIDGTHGWVLNGTSLRTLTVEEATDVGRAWVDVFAPVKARKVPGMVFHGVEKIGDRDTYVVLSSSEKKSERYYFDAVTGLLVRKTTITHTSLLPIPDQIDFEDYRDVDGVKLPFAIKDSAIDTYNSWTRTFTDIKRDVPVDATTFTMPVVPLK